MSAQFDAGSIEGTLDLDTSPFRRGLQQARAQAAAFTRQQVEPQLDLDVKRFLLARAEVAAQLAVLDKTVATPRVDLDAGGAMAKIAALQIAMSRISRGMSITADAGGLGRALTGPLLMAAKLTAIPMLLMGVAAAAAPATAALVALGGAAVTALSGAAIGFGLFGAAVANAAGILKTANEEGVKLTGWAGKAQESLGTLKDSWADMMKEVRPAVFRSMSSIFDALNVAVPKLAPVIQTVARGVATLGDNLKTMFKRATFDEFLDSLNEFMDGFMGGMAKVLPNFLSGLMNLFIAMQPLLDAIGGSVIRASEGFAQWAENLKNGGIQGFFEYATRYVPQFLDMIGDLLGMIVSIGKGLAPLTGPAIAFFSALFDTIAKIDLTPLSKGFGEMFDTLTPLLEPLGDFINGLLDLVGPMIGDIGKVFRPFADALLSMEPAFTRLKDALEPLRKPFADFIGAIANFVNTTGVAIITTLIDELARVLTALGPPLLDAAIWLEGLVDKGLEAMLPVLEDVLGLVADLAEQLGEWLAPAIKKVKDFAEDNPEVVGAFAGTLLGLAVAVWAVTTATAAFAIAANATGIPLLIIGIAALVAGLVYAYKHSDRFREIVDAMGRGLKRFAEWVRDDAWPAIRDFSTELAERAWPIIKKVGEALRDFGVWVITDVVPAVKKLAGQVRDNLAPIFEQLAETFREDVWPAMKKIWRVIKDDVWPVVKKFAVFVRDEVFPVLKGWTERAVKIWSVMVRIGTAILGHVMPPLIRFWGFMIRNIVPAIATWIGWVSRIIGWLIDLGGRMIAMGRAGNDMARLIGDAVGDVVGWFRDLPGRIAAFGGRMLEAGKSLMGQVIEGLKNGITGIGGTVYDIASSLVSAIRSGLNSALSLPLTVTIDPPGPMGPWGPYTVIPYLASGGVTTGEQMAVVGDNPGGREAIIPLDKYDLPKKGDLDRLVGRTGANESRMIALLEQLVTKMADPETMAEALGAVVGEANKVTIRAMIQAARSA